MTIDLTGRRIIVTGAATGIGLAAVKTLSAAGAEVVAIFRSSTPPDDVAESAAWLQCDLTDRESVVTTFDAAVKELGGLDVLLHCAGLWAAATPTSVTGDDLAATFTINLNTTLFTN